MSLKMTPLAIRFLVLVASSVPVFASAEPIALETPTGAINGTLLMPARPAKPAVVLMIAGSGPTDRDGNTPMASGKNNSLKLLAVALAEMGVASVRYDKRGIAASAGAALSESDLRIEDYVDDAASWVTELKGDKRFASVIVLGHSEGSLIGMLASQRSSPAAFISIAGPAEKAADVLRRQLKGHLPADVEVRSEEILKSLEAGRPAGDVPSSLLFLYRPSVQPYLMSWFHYSPARELAKLRVPRLIVQGATKMVPSDPSRQIASYGDPQLPIAADLVLALNHFFSQHGVRRSVDAGR